MEANDYVFGLHAVIETVKAGKTIDKLLIDKELAQSVQIKNILEEARKYYIPVSKVPSQKLNQITRKNHQGAIAILSAVEYVSLSSIVQGIYEKGETPLILVLDRITDVRNFGAIVRSAECAGVHAVLIPARAATQAGSDAMKTSSGALNFMPICREFNLLNSLQYLHDSGLQLVACTEKTEKLIYEADFSSPTAIVMGSEEDGISHDLLAFCDVKAALPMRGQIGSLNVSAAAAVVLYEALRQRIS